MSEKDDDTERELPASEKRLQQAREEGRIPRSRDLAGGLIGISAISLLWSTSTLIYSKAQEIFSAGLRFDIKTAKDPMMMAIQLEELMKASLWMTLPVLGILCSAALIGHVAIGGFVFSQKKLTPDFSKINPFKGIKNILSLNSLVEVTKSILKMIVLGFVGYKMINASLDELYSMSRTSVFSGLEMSIGLFFRCAFWLTFSYLVISLLDAPYQLWTYYKGLRMSLEEVKREHKESDGDPMVKGRMREIARKMSQNRMMQSVHTADVVITNPTHYSVAIKYVGEDGPPRVVAKGKGEVALAIRQIAREKNIPIVEFAPLARALYKHVKVDKRVSREFFAVVAKVLAYVYSVNDKRYKGAKMPSEQEIPPGYDPGPD